MLYYEVSPFKITHRTNSVLTYTSDKTLKVGQIVRVEVGKKSTIAIVERAVKKPSFETKPILSSIEDLPLPTPLVSLHQWISEYYITHPAHVWRTMLPSGLAKKRRNPKTKTIAPVRDTNIFTLNADQKNAVQTILQSPPKTHLLHGVTGSGKTAVYVELARRTVASGKSAIVLVPEIALTSQLIAEFTPYFPDVHVTHSTMTEAARHTLWKMVLRATTPQVIIGPRSAIFMPVRDLGLIIIDECHEPAFKQEQSPRYSAIRAASMLSKYAKARLVLGSATPSVTDYYLAQSSDAILKLPKPARADTSKPTITLVNMTKRTDFTQSPFFSNTFISNLSEVLSKNQQALVFHNRRGSAPTTLCESCGWSASCPRCFVPLTLHADSFHLRCHLCNFTEKVPTSCPDCHHANIIHRGIGTKRVEEELRRFFPKARIARFDSDTKTGVEQEYQSLYNGDIDIIVGTQVIAKGLDLPNLRFVGVVQADSGLALPDYQSSERVFQLIAQVVGRVGRSKHASRVVIQSYQPDHPSVTFGITQDYENFYTWNIAERRQATFPPFCYLLRLTTVYKTETGAIRAAQSLMALLREKLPASVELLGPTPAFYERLRSTYRWQIIVKSSKRTDLASVLKFLPPKGWQAELDPVNLL